MVRTVRQVSRDRVPLYRRLQLPHRRVADSLILSRPGDGAPVILPATAAVLWTLLDDWSDETNLRESLALRYPAIDHRELETTVSDLLERLVGEGVLEQR